VIFAVRVGLFHCEPERARAVVEPWLAPGGGVRAFFDPPGLPEDAAARLSGRIADHALV
jgi:hypothetical protein